MEVKKVYIVFSGSLKLRNPRSTLGTLLCIWLVQSVHEREQYEVSPDWELVAMISNLQNENQVCDTC